MPPPSGPPEEAPQGVALALSRIGAHVSRRFADRVATIDLSPGDAAVLRVLGFGETLSQRDLARRMGLAPSRMVVLIDSLQERGLVARSANEHDRRRYDVVLTAAGRERLGRLRELAVAHEREILGPLSGDEAQELRRLLGRLEAGAGLNGEGHSWGSDPGRSVTRGGA